MLNIFFIILKVQGNVLCIVYFLRKIEFIEVNWVVFNIILFLLFIVLFFNREFFSFCGFFVNIIVITEIILRYRGEEKGYWWDWDFGIKFKYYRENVFIFSGQKRFGVFVIIIG